jgi:hypothetical protein
VSFVIGGVREERHHRNGRRSKSSVVIREKTLVRFATLRLLDSLVRVGRMLRIPAHRARTRALSRLAAVLTLSLVMSGCTGLVYNRLDSLAGWYLGSLVSLDGDQKRDLREWLTRLLKWHRASELGRYAEFLRDLAERSGTRGDRDVYEHAAAQVERFGEAVIARAGPEAARLLATLNDEQLTQLDENLEERALERAEKTARELEKGSWRKEQARELRRQLKRWTGAVTKEQEAIIAQSVEQFEPTAQEWTESQHRWRKLLIATLRTPATPAREQDVLQLLREPSLHWTDAYSAKNRRNRERTFALLERLDGSLTHEQRAHLQRELEQLADQLDALRET